jgi:signal transduction histidine kinase
VGHLLEDPQALELPPGTNLPQAIEELGLLREALRAAPGELDRALDRAILALQRKAAENAIKVWSGSQRALDRIFAAQVADALLEALLEGAPAIDSCSLFTAAGGRLTRRASAGLARELVAEEADALVQLAARRGHEASVRDAAHEPLLDGSALQASGLRALVAIPLVQRGALLGALQAGSRTAYELGEIDRLLLGSAAARAVALLSHETSQRLERWVALQSELARVLAESSSTQVALRGALQAVCKHLGWDLGLAWVQRGVALRCEAIWTQHGLAADGEERLRKGEPPEIATQAANSNKPVWSRDVGELGMHGEVLRRSGLRCALFVPVRVGEESLGVVELASLTLKVPEAQQWLEALCNVVGQFLRRARAQELLRESEALKAGSLASAMETAHFREHFVGIVGHDLRNPLTAILTSAQLLLRHGGLSDRQARAITRIAHSAERMARMIGDLLDFTRSRLGGGFPIHPLRIDLRELSTAVIEELELAYPTRTVEFSARGDGWGTWDPDRMAQAVSNLVGNALQHSPEQSTVRVELLDEGDRIRLETTNAGPAIPAEVLPHIFEPGRRGTGGRGRKESTGLGLGLFIVEQIVLAHGGTIAVRSSAEEGTTFSVSLPRRPRAFP